MQINFINKLKFRVGRDSITKLEILLHHLESLCELISLPFHLQLVLLTYWYQTKNLKKGTMKKKKLLNQSEVLPFYLYTKYNKVVVKDCPNQ